MPSFAKPSIRKTPGWQPGARVENDYYPTPIDAVRELMALEPLEGSIWEPACGRGHISRYAKIRGHFVVSTDLHDYGFGQAGIDFLSERAPRARNIVTNPPFGKGLADRFVEHALSLTANTGGKVVMLLDLASLCHPMRTTWWQRHAPARIYAIDECVCWDVEAFGPKPWRTDVRRYCWVVWDPQHKGPTQFGWISTVRNKRLQ